MLNHLLIHTHTHARACTISSFFIFSPPARLSHEHTRASLDKISNNTGIRVRCNYIHQPVRWKSCSWIQFQLFREYISVAARDAGKTYYIINTLYNTVNIWCHKSASCLLGLRASGVCLLQSNRTSSINLLQNLMGIFVEIGKAPTTFLKIYCKRVCLYDALCIRLFPSLHRPVTYIAFRVQIDFLSPFSVPFTFITPPLLLHHKPVLYIAVLMRAFSPPSSLSRAQLRQSIYPALAGRDGGWWDCRVDCMLQNHSTDRHTSWQLQNQLT